MKLITLTQLRQAGGNLWHEAFAAGRLVAPFDMVLPQDAGYYVVAPEATAASPGIACFRDWLIASAQPAFPDAAPRAITDARRRGK